MKKFFIITFLVAFCCLGANNFSALAEREDPGNFLERMFKAGGEALKKEQSFEGKLGVVKNFIAPAVDVDGIGLRALSSFAKIISSQEKDEYIDLFDRHFFKNNKIINKLAQSKEVRFEQNEGKHGKEIDGNWAKVYGTLWLDGTGYKVWFSLIWKAEINSWIVVDAGSAEYGLSGCVIVYNTEFSEYMRGNSAKYLISYLKLKLAGKDPVSRTCDH